MNHNILVITGGISNEKELSLISGRDVVEALLNLDQVINFEVLEITDDKKMILFKDPQLFLEDTRGCDTSNNRIIHYDYLNFFPLVPYNYDVAFLALDGTFGEDGHVQALLNIVNIPYTGSGIMASSIGMNKSKCYEYVSCHGVKVPDYFLVHKHDYEVSKVIARIESNIFFPCVVKPNDSGSSIGISCSNSKDEIDTSLLEALDHSETVIVQRFIKGREFACGVLGNSQRTELQVLPVAESMLKNFEVFTHYQKYYAHDSEEVCPAVISEKLKSTIMKNAQTVHEVLGCDGLSRSDFRYDEQNDTLYFLEVNTLPGHTKNSICPQEARALGMSFGDFVLKQIDLALL